MERVPEGRAVCVSCLARTDFDPGALGYFGTPIWLCRRCAGAYPRQTVKRRRGRGRYE